MKKTLILLTAFSLFGCGSVDKQINKEQIKEDIKQTETTSEKQVIETNTKSTQQINFSALLSEFELQPIDNTKPFFVGSQKFENVKVTQKTEQKDFSKDINFVQKQTDYRFVEMQKEIETLKEELTKSRDVKRFDWTWLLIVIVLIILGYFLYRKYKVTSVF
jgi:hypothetical protein